MAKVVVDASGDGDVAARAGVPFWQTVKDEAPRLNDALMYRIEFGAAAPDGTVRLRLRHQRRRLGPGVPARSTAPTPTSSPGRRSPPACGSTRTSPTSRQSTPSWPTRRVVETPPLLGIRQTRFIEGEYKLTADDAITGRRFDDVVAISSCPIIHYYGYRRYLEHEGYDIPYRCLVPLKVDEPAGRRPLHLQRAAALRVAPRDGADHGHRPGRRRRRGPVLQDRRHAAQARRASTCSGPSSQQNAVITLGAKAP